MNVYQLGAAESRFADVIWENEPISSTELAKKSAELLGWKKSTTYTVLKRLTEKGIFKNDNGNVTSLISKEKFFSMQSKRFVEDTFGGSLPAFLAAFTSAKSLTAEEVAELKSIINEYGEG